MPLKVCDCRFENKVAVVTGGAQGIGLASAMRMGREGARILIVDIAEGAAAEAVADLTGEGIAASYFAADLSEPEGAEAALACAGREFGGVDVVINNVGGTIWKKPFWHYTAEEIREEIRRSFWPSLWTAHAAVRAMRAGGGSIVNIGSNATDGVYRIPYSACKGAIAALTTSLAAEVAHLDIRVNCVALGGTTAPERKTPRNPRPLSQAEVEWERQFFQLIGDEDLMGRFSTAEEQAAVIAFLASDDAAHMTGEVILTGRRGRRIPDVLGFEP